MTGVVRLVAVLALGAVAGCGAPANDATRATDDSTSASTTSPASPSTTQPPPDPCDASLRPFATQPQPGAMPAGILEEIQSAAVLRVGVDQNTLGFGWRDRDGQLEGFDISLAEEIGLAMFGDPGHVDLVPVTSRERIGAVDDGHVDLVISVMTITCERAGQVAFSTEYFRARQRVLVRADSDIETIDDLADRSVCATATSTSLDNLAGFAPEAVPYEVPARTDCLVALQQGLVDAISTDDTILRGFMAQDPKLRLLPGGFSEEQYGIAVRRDAEHEDLVRFVNGVLEDMRADGRWAGFLADAEAQLGVLEPPSDTPPLPVYLEDT